MPQFHLIINLGNDAMQTPEDVAERLDRAALTLRRDGFTGHNCPDPSIRQVLDRNGNVVGHYEVVDV